MRISGSNYISGSWATGSNTAYSMISGTMVADSVQNAFWAHRNKGTATSGGKYIYGAYQGNNVERPQLEIFFELPFWPMAGET